MRRRPELYIEKALTVSQFTPVAVPVPVPVPDSGFRVPDSGFRIPDSGFQVSDSGFRILAFPYALFTLFML